MSSFQKRRNLINIPGTKPSLQNGQLLVSTGNLSLDHILGGGIPIGSILLIGMCNQHFQFKLIPQTNIYRYRGRQIRQLFKSII